jgi:hypothetical protein
LSFNTLLYPNIKETRKLLSFLFEFLFKSEDEQEQANKVNNQPSNEFETLVKRRLQKWQSKPWILPDFLKIKKNVFVGAGDKIKVSQDLDFQRIAQCKSKKAKGVFELMQTFKNGTVGEDYQAGTNILSKVVMESSWNRGQAALVTKKGGPSMLRGQDEDEEEEEYQQRGPNRVIIKKINKAQVLEEFKSNFSTLAQPGSAAMGAAAEVGEQTLTLKEVLEKRDEELKDIEQLQGT